MDNDTALTGPVEPSNVDLIVVGSGVPESILALAAAAAGKSVLLLGPHLHYGYHSATLRLNEFVSFLGSQSESPSQTPLQTSNNDDSIPLTTRPLYSEIEIKSYSSEPLESSGKIWLELEAPRLFLCGDGMIDLILKMRLDMYIKLLRVDASFLSDAGGKLESVPDSRSTIFKTQDLSRPEKRQLMNFFKRVEGHFGNEMGEKISEQELESPFIEFLTKERLSQKLKSIILYTIVLADYDQENLEVCKDVISTKSGIARLARYHSSIGRFSDADCAMMYPLSGHGGIPEALCRRAAVTWELVSAFGRCVTALLMDKDGRTYRGVRLASGQELFSRQLILAPSFTIAPSSPPAVEVTNSDDISHSDATGKVARGICITKNSLNPEVANCLVFFPPRSLYPEQLTSVRVLQLSSNVELCPPDMFVTYLSAACDNAVEGKKLLNAAINALFSTPVSSSSENDGIDNLCERTKEKPFLLWRAMYIQDLTRFHTFNSITFTPMPDEHLVYDNIIDATEKIFKEIYPNEDFFAITKAFQKPIYDFP